MKRAHQHIIKVIEEMIREANRQWLEKNEGQAEAPLPLVRLKVEYSGFVTLNPQRVGQQFVGKVANPKDIVLFYRRRKAHVPSKETGTSKLPIVEGLQPSLPDKLDHARIEDLVNECLELQKLDLFPENELGDSVRVFVEKQDNDAIKEYPNSILIFSIRTANNLILILRLTYDTFFSIRFVAGSLLQTREKVSSTNPETENEIIRQITVEKKLKTDSYAGDSSLEYILSRRNTASISNTDPTTFSDGEMETPLPTSWAAASKNAKSALPIPAAKRKQSTARKSPPSRRTRKKVESSSDGQDSDMEEVDEEDGEEELDTPPPKKIARRTSPRSKAKSAAEAEPIVESAKPSQTILNFAPLSQASSQRSLPSSFAVGRGRGRGRGKR
jgi:double-strand break repair protein MRE11